jgi:LysM repeat protein
MGLFSVLAAFVMAQNSQVPALAQEPVAAQRVSVQKHYSRWAYPEEVVVGPNQSLHIVVKGDTLWDLAQKYLGNPWIWPQIWELNKWVLYPHWIYPGNPLLIPVGTAVIGQETVPTPDKDIANLQPDPRIPSTTASPSSMVKYAYSFMDYLHLPYLVPKGADAHFKELGAVRVSGNQKEDRGNFSKGDVVYLDGGRSKGQLAGDRLMVLKVAKPRLIHPDDTLGLHPLGDVIQHAAILRVLSVHPRNSEAVIEDTLDGVTVGDYASAYVEPTLIQAVDAPLRKDTLEPIPLGKTAKIVFGRSGATFFSTGSLVIIDKGSGAGFKQGDVLACVRMAGLDRQADAASQQTNRYLGQMLVVRTDYSSSTCLILSARSEMTLGDIVTD